ncbi:hypothetical protein [Streptomyces uncialis]|uniref:hypothetical protein n=1 Tax=Streptomyces uncialis TaxID=1048205 RepID=UPI003867ED17|nr:hypothetical protein OG924_17390 [Streptomyces uncialis]
MFGLGNALGARRAETATRHIHATIRRIFGEAGNNAANTITDRVLGLGRIDICDRPDCEDCAPIQ